MIPYHFRYRGAYEYDKFILNFFQMSNEVVEAKKRLFKNSSVEQGAVIKGAEAVESAFQDEIIKTDTSGALYLSYLKVC